MISSIIKDHECEVQIKGDQADITIEFLQLLKAFDKNNDLKLIIVTAILEYLKEENR